MEQVRKLLEERQAHLGQMKKEKEKALKNAPEGALRICNYGGKVRYYQRKNPKDLNGIYLREKEFHITQKLAQKDYNKKVLRSIEKELKTIENYLSNYPEKNAEQIYACLHRERQKLITPILEPDEQYIRNWESIEYEGKGFRDDVPELYTSKGERVRSKSELIIADLLNREKIPYRYEYPIYLKGIGKIYPDFTVLNVRQRKEMYCEHLGMMDDSSYVENALQKIALYEQNEIFPGEQLILTYETRKIPINQKALMKQIQYYFK